MPTQILLSASEAYPALERQFLSAQSRIDMGFRVFDPLTPLLSPEARAVGRRWCDLMVDTLNRGVSIFVTLSDFDPIMAYSKHSRCWHHMRVFLALNELTRPGAGRLQVRAGLHPAQGGLIPRLMFALPTRKRLAAVCEEISQGPAVQRALDHAPGLAQYVTRAEDGRVVPRAMALPQLNPVTLHHKMAVIDDSAVYVGGLDLNARRFDDPSHDQPAQGTWQDVQLIVTDPDVIRDARAYLRNLPAVVTDRRRPPRHEAAFRVTLSRKRRNNLAALSPHPMSREILRTHLRLIAGARHHIYLESQYFRDGRIARALARAARRVPGLTLVLVLPGAPEDVAFEGERGLDARFGEYLQARAIRTVRRGFKDRFIALSPVQRRRVDARDTDDERASLAGAPLVYTHAKVTVIDDTAAFVGSANLNGRSMSWDAEAGVELRDPTVVAELRARLWRHWSDLNDSADPAPAPAGAFAAWHRMATDNARRPPEHRVGFMVPYRLKAADMLATPIPGAPEEMV